jgi:exopolyphosphatase/guanosine-5'-triphosphate,3'-diphosphate pyrophosphatase
MQTHCRAVIDVGTNSVKVLIAEVHGRQIHPLREESAQTRLGRGFYQEHRLRPDAIADTAKAVMGFVSTARHLGAASVRIIATSAARDAVNADELVSALERAAGVKVEIITGEQEAIWTARGVLTDPRLDGERMLIMDLGGGSTEFILTGSKGAQFHRSFPLGTVRLLEQIPHSDPPLPSELVRCLEFARGFLRGTVKPELLEAGNSGEAAPQLMVGTGGTAAILGRIEGKMGTFDREKIEAQRLSPHQVQGHCESLWRQTLAQRQSVPGLPPNRADVILTGAVIYQAVMEVLELKRLQISTRGLRWAALID